MDSIAIGLYYERVNREKKQPFSPAYFRREDESPDPLFYTQPRLVVHIDQYAIKAIGDFLDQFLPRDGVLLDLMSSWCSHLPPGFPKVKLIGLGLNAEEMARNPQLDGAVVHDLNRAPGLPFTDGSFGAAMVTVSIQYLTRPVEVFREVHRVLKPGAAFHVIYSNRMFPTKATAVWKSLSDADRGKLVAAYFIYCGGWRQPELRDVSPRLGFYTDPVYVVSAKKKRDRR